MVDPGSAGFWRTAILPRDDNIVFGPRESTVTPRLMRSRKPFRASRLHLAERDLRRGARGLRW
jgi:hypothetical protein